MQSLAVGVIALISSLYMAYTIGANSNSPSLAPAVGANAIPVMRAALFIGIFGGLGAVLQGASISDTVGRGMIKGVSITPLAAGTALLISAVLISIGNQKGYPIPAAFAVTGSIIGVGLALNGEPATQTYTMIAGFWLLIPIAGVLIAYSTAKILRRPDVPETVSIPLIAGLVGLTAANMRLGVIPSETRRQGSISEFISLNILELSSPQFHGINAWILLISLLIGAAAFLITRRTIKQNMESGVSQFLVVLGALVVFSSGGAQVGLATGPLEAFFSDELKLDQVYLLVLGGSAILIGSWIKSPRVVQAVSREYSKLGLRRSISALVPAYLITQTAITLGLPISMNQIIISSVIGSGLVEGSGGVSSSKIGYTAFMWLLTLGGSALTGYILYPGLSSLIGTT